MAWNKMSTSGGAAVDITEKNFPFFKNYSINLFNIGTMSVDSGLNNVGVLNTYAGGGTSDFIPVVAGDVIRYNTDVWKIAAYNSTKTFISNLTGSASINTTVPSDGTAFIRVFSVVPNTTMIVKNIEIPNTYMRGEVYLLDKKYSNDKLAGKIWVHDGDSISYGLHAEKTGTDRWPYPRIIADRSGVILQNYGTSGATMGEITGAGRTDSSVQRYTNYRSDADIITIAMGTNDTEGIVPLGTAADNVTTTFYGALNTLVPGLINRYPGKKIGFITPLPRSGGYTQEDAKANAIKEVCGKHSIPVLDLLRVSRINPNLSSINAMYYSTTGYESGDGLHPNYQGHLVIADPVEAFLRSL